MSSNAQRYQHQRTHLSVLRAARGAGGGLLARGAGEAGHAEAFSAIALSAAVAVVGAGNLDLAGRAGVARVARAVAQAAIHTALAATIALLGAGLLVSDLELRVLRDSAVDALPQTSANRFASPTQPTSVGTE
jgi:hypothetical protein